LNSTLGILLPVYNAQKELADRVTQILDVLPEWADRFELVIVDDGSADETAEVARELAAQYPQLRVLRHPVRLGLSEAIQTGLDDGSCEVILIGNGAYELEPDDLRLLWKLREAEGQFARQQETAARLARRRGGPPERPRPRTSLDQRLGFQSISRATYEQLRLAETIDALSRIDAANRTGMPGGRPTAWPSSHDKPSSFRTGQQGA
jgi:glycosyltransferase involved in cell wall biosynthesis